MKKQAVNPRFEFCKTHFGQQVFVGGMYPGDFIGTLFSHTLSEGVFRVEKPVSGSA